MRNVNTELGVTTLIVTHDPTVSDHVSRTIQIRDGRTSTEVLRRSASPGANDGSVAAQTYTVIDDLGRLQLPQEYVTNLHLHERVRLALETDHVGVFPGRGRHVDPAAAPEDAPPVAPEAGDDHE
jgi:ABC-type sulfate/molybdate transport systems ATPase subunit